MGLCCPNLVTILVCVKVAASVLVMSVGFFYESHYNLKL